MLLPGERTIRNALLAGFFFLACRAAVARPLPVLSLQPADTVMKSRVRIVGGVTLGLYPLSMAWLYSEWYRDYPQSAFHTFNDGGEWLQADKVGHMWTAYNIAKPLARSFRWAGISSGRSAWYGTGISFLYLTTIEVFDGFSEQWGFSWGDMAANTLGAGLFVSQELAWEKQRIMLKYSYHPTDYPPYRPGVLGGNAAENFLKDYNGWTYWLCVLPASWKKKPSPGGFPPWLGFAAGYGVDGLTGGESNPPADGTAPEEFSRQRQYYVSLDIDLSKVRWKSRFLDSFFKVITIIKLPAPAVEFNSGGKTKFYLLYF
jgi:hypothetical protein